MMSELNMINQRNSNGQTVLIRAMLFWIENRFRGCDKTMALMETIIVETSGLLNLDLNDKEGNTILHHTLMAFTKIQKYVSIFFYQTGRMNKAVTEPGSQSENQE